MNISVDQAIYRVRRTRRDGLPVKHYRGTWVLSDEATKQVLATCDLMGVVTFRSHDIVDGGGQVWRLAANRAIMPSRWLLTDPARRLVLQFDQQILRKFLNPWRRTGLVLRDASGREVFRLVGRKTGVLDRIFGPGIHDWTVMESDKPAARLVHLPTQQEAPKGMLGRMARLVARADQGIASVGQTHALSAPAALALLMLVDGLDPSGVG